MPSTRVVYASAIPGVVLDCDLASGATAGGGKPTDNAAAINAVLATATAASPLHLIIDGGAAMSVCPILPATGHVMISGLGWSTGFFILPGANSNGLQNFAGTDLERVRAVYARYPQAGVGANVCLRDFRIHCNRGPGFPRGNVDGRKDGTLTEPNFAKDSPDIRSPFSSTLWLTGITLVGIDHLRIDNVWCYDSCTYSLNLYHCTDVVITGSRFEAIDTTNGNNTDGIHLNGGCSNVRISGCYIASGDDAFALNIREGDGAPASDIIIADCVVKGLTLGRIYGMGANTLRRVQFHNITGTLGWWGLLIGEGNSAVDTGVESNTSILLDGIDLQIIGGPGPSASALVVVAANVGAIELNRCKVVDPIQVRPLVAISHLACSVSTLRLTNCGIHRSASGNAPAYAVDASRSGSIIGELVITDFHVTEQAGQRYADIPELVHLGGTVVGSMSFSGRVKGVGTVVGLAGGSTLGSLTIPDLTHVSNADGASAHSVVVAGPTVPVSVGCHSGTNLAGIAAANVTLTGPGILPSGYPVADALMGDGSLYLGSEHKGAPCIKVAGVAHVLAMS